MEFFLEIHHDKKADSPGAFVDIGVHQDGLVHVSQLADRYVSDPTQVVRLHQHVRVRVIGVDLRRQRISLSMKGINKK